MTIPLALTERLVCALKGEMPDRIPFCCYPLGDAGGGRWRASACPRADGKRTLNHMDGMLGSLLDSVARCPIDIIEAFNPTPDGNVSVAEVLAAWPNKALAIDFPSSVHVRSPEEIHRVTVDLLWRSAPAHGFAVGITENTPSDVAVQSLTVIPGALDEHGHCPLDAELPGHIPT